MPLNPAPDDLGLHSPAIGPWFSNADVQLPAPGVDTLFLDLNLGAAGARSWLPPAAGTLSFAISTVVRPAPLARLRDAAGNAAFTDDRLIALFRLLPEVEDRLSALTNSLPTLAGATATNAGARRPRVRWFALEMTQAAPNYAFLSGLLPASFAFPPDVTTPADRAKHLGLVDGGTLSNGPKPMTDLVRPEQRGAAFAELLRFSANTPVRLWVFDRRGHPIDPGAVANWWNFLATDVPLDFTNLWEDTLDAGNQRTAPLAAANVLSMHLVNLHGGPLTPEALARVNNAQNVNGAGIVRTRGNTNNAAQLGFTAAPDPDDLPVPQMGVLPDGRLGATVSLWQAGPVNAAITRDFARVAVGSMEHHLVGQPRVGPTGAGLSAADTVRKRRADDQNRASTRLNVARANRPALQATLDPAIQAVLNVFGGGGATQLVTSALTRDFGARAAGLPAVNPPPFSNKPSATAVALTGGGTDNGGVAQDQRVLITLTWADPSTVPANAWVRAWTQDFDHDKAEHTRREGGAGRVNAAGSCALVARLADGSSSPDALMGMEVMVSTANGQVLYSDVRFARPAPVGGGLANFAALAGTTQVLVCDTGAVANQSATTNLPSGAVLVADPTGTPALVDPGSVPVASWAATTVGRSLAAADVVQLTEPAFKKLPAGEAAATLATATGATVKRRQRQIQSAWENGFPLPGMLRLEHVAANVDGTGGTAAMTTVPGLGPFHELLPHRQGHPECPAHQDTHGTGIAVTGPAAVAFAEYTRDRTADHTFDLVTAASTVLPVPAAPTADSVWVAGLRTEAAGVAAEVGLASLLDTGLGVGFKPYPFGGTWATVEQWLNDNIASIIGSNVDTLLGATSGQIDSVIRALDRRLLTQMHGAREGATSVIAAIERAEDFIYIETPGLDSEAFGAADDPLDLWSSLLQRMTARPDLQVVVCLPVELPEGYPRHLQRVRDALVAGALAEVNGAPNDRASRIVAFHPAAGPQRALAISSTTVIVDDAYAMTGTTHLWRRGLSFDSSFAVAVADDRLQDGRAQEVLTFRRALVAARLGLAANQLPDDPAELVQSIALLSKRGGHGRLAPQRIRPPTPDPAFVSLIGGSALTEADVWNRDGSTPAGFNPVQWLLELTPAVQSGEFNP